MVCKWIWKFLDEPTSRNSFSSGPLTGWSVWFSRVSTLTTRAWWVCSLYSILLHAMIFMVPVGLGQICVSSQLHSLIGIGPNQLVPIIASTCESRCLWYQQPVTSLPQDSATCLDTQAISHFCDYKAGIGTLNVVGSSVSQPWSCPGLVDYYFLENNLLGEKKTKNPQVYLRRRPGIIGNENCLIRIWDSYVKSILKIKCC